MKEIATLSAVIAIQIFAILLMVGGLGQALGFLGKKQTPWSFASRPFKRLFRAIWRMAGLALRRLAIALWRLWIAFWRNCPTASGIVLAILIAGAIFLTLVYAGFV